MCPNLKPQSFVRGTARNPHAVEDSLFDKYEAERAGDRSGRRITPASIGAEKEDDES